MKRTNFVVSYICAAPLWEITADVHIEMHIHIHIQPLGPHHPSTTISVHVTVDLEWLVLIATEEDGVQARRTITIQENLGTVSGTSVLHTS